MAFRCGGISTLFLILSLLTSSAFAAEILSYTAQGSTTIITIGFAAFGLLAIFVLYLGITFLLKELKASALAAKEKAKDAPDSPRGETLLNLVLWLGGAFGLMSLGSIFVGFLFILAQADLSGTKSLSSFIVSCGFAGFALLVLYLVFLALSPLFKRKPKAAVQGVEGEGLGLPGPEMTRRSFLSLLGWAWVAFTAATLGALSTVLRFFFPNVTFEPPLKFKAGFPDTYSLGVDERYKEGHRVWIVRNNQGFYALSTICTHLGCTPNWLQAEQKFKCPCHGSGFYITGINFEGPAPRPLPRFLINLSDDGQIEIDEAVQFQYELGQWGLPGSFLDYTG